MIDDVEWCCVCGEYYSDSRIEVRKHIMESHTLEERLAALHESKQPPEDTRA